MSKNKKVFTSPGSLIYVGKEVEGFAKIKLIEYNETEIIVNNKLNNSAQPVSEMVHWYQIKGLHDINSVSEFGKKFKLHPLILEDVLNTHQKPKLEIFYNQHIFVTLKYLTLKSKSHVVESSHIGLILGTDYVLSFRESSQENLFKSIEDRLKASIGKTRKGNADYLFYTLCDVVVDSYFLILEELTEKLEDLELRIIENPSPEDQKLLYAYRREILILRKAILPLRDMFSALLREESNLISEQNKVYFRDIYDHVLQVLDSADSLRELIDNIQNLYLNSLSQKMNSVMKTLTIFSAIFMPLTFIAGIYGMNFENMPELSHRYAYYYCLAGMLILSVVLWFYFKWKKYF